MCHLCRTRQICERLEASIAEIDRASPVGLQKLREVLVDAREDLARYHNASVTFDHVVNGAEAKITPIAHVDSAGTRH